MVVNNISTDNGRMVDLGYGKTIEMSSVWGDAENTKQLLPAVYGYLHDYSFHTDLQQDPFVIVDLKYVRLVRRIRVFNRESIPGRAIPLAISMSLDKESWSEIARINYVFAGRILGEPLDLKLLEGIHARYLKFQVLSKTYLHLDYIEISALIPDLELGSLQNVKTSGPSISADYFHHSSYGFTWTFTQTLRAISLCRSHDIAIHKIDYSNCLAPFKDKPGLDIYPVLFSAPQISEQMDALSHVPFFHHGIYATLDLAQFQRYANIYFSPSAEVIEFQKQIRTKYSFQADNAIALVYRGTDKSSEVNPTPIERYIAVALAALRSQPDLQVVIQTDQQQALDAVIKAIPHAIFFEELPVTTGTMVMHHLPLEKDFNLSRLTFAIRMMAAVHMLSTAKYIVTHTGNIGLWLAFYRGTANGFYQFDKDTKLRDPVGAVVEDVSNFEIA